MIGPVRGEAEDVRQYLAATENNLEIVFIITHVSVSLAKSFSNEQRKIFCLTTDRGQMISTTNVTVEQRLGMGAAAVVMLSEIIKLKPKLSGRTCVGTVPMLLSTVIGCWRSFDQTKWPSDVSSMQIIAKLEAPSLSTVIVYIVLFAEFTGPPCICSTKYGKYGQVTRCSVPFNCQLMKDP